MKFLRSAGKSPLSDEEILLAYRRLGDPQLLGVLFERYSHLAFAVCYNYFKNEADCKDAVIFIFEKLATDLHRYEIRHFSSWLHTVTRNYCLRQLSKSKKTVPIDLPEQLESTAPEIEDEGHSLVHLEHLEEALSSLSDEQKICIRKFFLLEKSYQEISAETGYTLNQVKSYIQNGKRNLRIYLQKKTNASQ